MDTNKPLAGGPASPGKAPERSRASMIAVAVLIIGICVIGAFLLNSKLGFIPGSPAQTPTGTGNIPVIATQTIAVQQTVPTPTPANMVYSPGSMEANGIWVKVSYPGDFAGSLHAQGWGADVKGTGNWMYKVPVENTIIDGSITKMDASSNFLNVEVFNGGVRVSNISTSAPNGKVDVHVTVRKAAGGSPAPAPAVNPAK